MNLFKPKYTNKQQLQPRNHPMLKWTEIGNNEQLLIFINNNGILSYITAKQPQISIK